MIENKLSSKVSLHTNQYLIEDLQGRLGTENLANWIDLQADLLSSDGRVAAGYIHFSPELLEKRRIKRICEAHVAGQACIRPAQGDYYEITYDPKLSVPALRFAIAHEIGHTYWFRPGGGAKPLSPLQRRLGRDPDIEYLCNRFAEALLLPLSAVRSLENHYGYDEVPSLQAIREISGRFKLSEQAVVRRLFAVSGLLEGSIICLRKLTQKWVTQWCVTSDRNYEDRCPSGFRIPLFGKKTVPDDMLPEIPEGGTHPLALDGRWWQALKLVPSGVARTQFRSMPKGKIHQAFACRVSDVIYIALPETYQRDDPPAAFKSLRFSDQRQFPI